MAICTFSSRNNFGSGHGLLERAPFEVFLVTTTCYITPLALLAAVTGTLAISFMTSARMCALLTLA